MDEIGKLIGELKRRLEAKDRIIQRHVQFRLGAAKHMPALIEGDKRSIKYRDALKWWNDCNAVVTSQEGEAA